jgi:hypothetical protein
MTTRETQEMTREEAFGYAEELRAAVPSCDATVPAQPLSYRTGAVVNVRLEPMDNTSETFISGGTELWTRLRTREECRRMIEFYSEAIVR